MSEEAFTAEIRLVNEEGFHKTILEKTTFATQQGLITLVKAFEEGRRFAIGIKSGSISSAKAFEKGVSLLETSHEAHPSAVAKGFLLGYNNPTGKIEVVR